MTVSAYTPNFKLALIDFNSQNWHGDAWDNLMLIDAILKADFTNVPYGNAAGTNTITVDVTPNVLAYTSGLTVLFKLANAPTGATTLNVDGLGAKGLKIAGADVASGDLMANDVVRAIYDGTNFNVVEPLRVFAKIRITVGGGSGGTPALTADDFIINADVSAGITILTPNTAVGSINFGDAASSNAGSIAYNHNTDKLIFTSTLGHSFVGSVSVTGSLTLTGGVAAIGAITENGYQVWHAGNLSPSGYALLSGATFTGGVNVPTLTIVAAAATPNYLLLNNSINSGSGGKQWRIGDTGGAATGNFSITNITDGVTPFTFTPAGVGTFNFAVNVVGTLSQGGNAVWHAGNLTPANYLPLAGGTVTAAIIRSGKGAHLYHDATYTSGRIVVQAQSGASYTGFADGDFSFEY